MNTWTFKPLVNGEPVYDKDGTEVVLDVDIPKDANDVDIETTVDGEVLKPNYLLSDSAYNLLKWVGLLLLPTLAWGYTMLANAWGLPYAEQVPFTLNVIGTIIAVLIGASALNNDKGV